MEKNRKIIELLLALAFVGILLFTSIIVIGYFKEETQQSPVYQNISLSASYVINSYNLYNTYEINYITVNPTEIVNSMNWEEKESYNHEEWDIIHPNYREYSGQERRKDFLGSYVQEYYIYILNKERTGRYFTVVFNLEDKNGYDFSQSVTQYLRSGEEKKFVYRDIQFERNEIVDWDYEVIPEEY